MKKNRSKSKIITFETFKEFGSYDVHSLTNNEPSCWNSAVHIKKYRVTIEPIEEPKEVYVERLTKLWRENNNHHHWHPLKGVANEFGIILVDADHGIDRKKNR